MWGRSRRQLSLHEILPTFVGQTSSNQQVTPVRTTEHHRVVQPAKISMGDDEGGHLDALDGHGVASFARKDVIGQPRQRPDHPVDLIREINSNTTSHTLRDSDHDSRSHTGPATNKTH